MIERFPKSSKLAIELFDDSKVGLISFLDTPALSKTLAKNFILVFSYAVLGGSIKLIFSIGGAGTKIDKLPRTLLNRSSVILEAFRLNDPGLNTFNWTLAIPSELLIQGFTSTDLHSPVKRN